MITLLSEQLEDTRSGKARLIGEGQDATLPSDMLKIESAQTNQPLSSSATKSLGLVVDQTRSQNVLYFVRDTVRTGHPHGMCKELKQRGQFGPVTHSRKVKLSSDLVGAKHERGKLA